MPKLRTLLALAALAGFALVPAASADWLYSAYSVVRAEQEVQKHPKILVQTTTAAKDLEKPYLCVSYFNTVTLGDTGRVVATANLFLAPDGETISIKFAGGVKNNSFFNCKKGPDMPAGSFVVWNYEFKGMPRLRTINGPAEIAEVSGIISTAGEPSLGEEAPLGLVPPDAVAPLGLVPGEGGGWFHSTESIFRASKNNQKHPAKLAQDLLVPADAKRPKICVGYENVANQKNKGRVVTTVSIRRSDGSEEETIKFAGGVKDNEYLKCKKAGSVVEGDEVFFDFRFKGMPRLKMGSDGGDAFEIHGVLTASGDPLFREPPPPPPPPPAPAPPPEPAAAPTAPAPPPPPPPSDPGGGGGGGGGSGSGGGGISVADEHAVHKLLKSSTRGTQLWRAKNNTPGKWVAVGPKTKVIIRNQLDYKTAGVGSTIAAAVSDYERKTGSNLGSGQRITSTERSLLEWYSGINSSGGPTSVRRDGKGRYHGEYFRPAKGAVTKTLTSLAAALDWLRSQGL
jgi:hypothetical protein